MFVVANACNMIIHTGAVRLFLCSSLFPAEASSCISDSCLWNTFLCACASSRERWLTTRPQKLLQAFLVCLTCESAIRHTFTNVFATFKVLYTWNRSYLNCTTGVYHYCRALWKATTSRMWQYLNLWVLWNDLCPIRWDKAMVFRSVGYVTYPKFVKVTREW